MSHLNLSVSLNFSKGGIVINRSLHASVTVTGNVGYQSVQTVPTASELTVAVPAAIATDLGFIILHNMDSTNFIKVGTTATDYGTKLLPGEFCLFRLQTGKLLYARADTSDCDMEVILIEL